MPRIITDMLEREYLQKGYEYVIGVDEVGRGSWAGPVVVGAFVFTKDTQILPQVNDSKLVTKKRRVQLNEQLQSDHYKIANASVEEIDKSNILEATKLAIKRSISKLSLENSIVLIDGRFSEDFEFEYESICRGDSKHYSIAAASILAKVFRDSLMSNYSKKYPEYGFEKHVGYGTKRHREALEEYGVCSIHRRSYKPVRRVLVNEK